MPPKSAFSPAEKENRRAYQEAKAQQFGNLHERMKWLVGCKEDLRKHLEDTRDDRLRMLFTAVEIGVKDLETEVSYSKTAKPPFGRRVVERKDSTVKRV